MKLTDNTVEVKGYALPKSATMQVKKFDLRQISTGICMIKTQVVTSHEAAQICRNIHEVEGNNFQEFFYCVFLNRSNRPTGYYVASKGGVTETIADPKLIVKAAALADCTGLLLCHNHPSGNTMPSRADQVVTQKLKEACSFFDIQIVDHIICGDDAYYSFSDSGMI